MGFNIFETDILIAFHQNILNTWKMCMPGCSSSGILSYTEYIHDAFVCVVYTGYLTVNYDVQDIYYQLKKLRLLIWNYK